MTRHRPLGGGTIVGVVSENRASIQFLQRGGFEQVAHLREVGYKFGRYIDLIFLQYWLTEWTRRASRFTICSKSTHRTDCHYGPPDESPPPPPPCPPRFHEAENRFCPAEGEAFRIGSTPASNVHAVSDPGATCVATIMTASP